MLFQFSTMLNFLKTKTAYTRTTIHCETKVPEAAPCAPYVGIKAILKIKLLNNPPVAMIIIAFKSPFAVNNVLSNKINELGIKLIINSLKLTVVVIKSWVYKSSKIVDE